MISVLVIVLLLLCLLLLARRSSKNRDAILIEVILGIAGSVAAAVAVASFPKIDASNFLGQLDGRIYEVVFGKKADAPPPSEPTEAAKAPVPGGKAVTIKKNIRSGDRKIEGVYAGLIRAVRNGSDVLSEKAYILRVDPAKKQKVLEIYKDGSIEYKIRIDGRLQKDGVTWLGETKSVLKGETFVQDDLKLRLSPEVGRIDWLQRDKVHQIESIGTLYKIDEDAVSERISQVNKIKNNIHLCVTGQNGNGQSGSGNDDDSKFLFVPIGHLGGAAPVTMEGLAGEDKIFAAFIAGRARLYEGAYNLFMETGYQSKEFVDLKGMNILKADFASFMGYFDKTYRLGASAAGAPTNSTARENAAWFDQTWGETDAAKTCNVFFVGFPAVRGLAGQGASAQGVVTPQ